MTDTQKQVFVHRGTSREDQLVYVVYKMVNTLELYIGQALTKNEVNDLIIQGVKVTITSPEYI